jgi:hypothetical protein
VSLLETLGGGRRQPHHRLSEGDEIHAQSYVGPNFATRF